MSKRISDSRFWEPLWRYYAVAPSMAFCRIPELEYAATLNVSGRVLDHCCGDGYFASLAWPGKIITSGCDFSAVSIERAAARKIYSRLDVCDVSQRLPYDDGVFDLVFDNSAVEHVPNLDAVLREVDRVLAPNGVFAFNVLNHRYFEWWPLDQTAKQGYQNWQPFYHALNLETWTERLNAAGLRVVEVQGYFERKAARELALLDCEFSGVSLAQRPSKLVRHYRQWSVLSQFYWKLRLARATWDAEPDTGAGYFIKAVHA